MLRSRRGEGGVVHRRRGACTRHLPAAAAGGPWRRVFHGRYRWAGTGGGEDLRLRGIAGGLPKGFAFAGAAAARLLGLDLPPGRMPEVIVPPDAIVSTRAQAVIRRVQLEPGDVFDPATAIIAEVRAALETPPFVYKGTSGRAE